MTGLDVSGEKPSYLQGKPAFLKWEEGVGTFSAGSLSATETTQRLKN